MNLTACLDRFSAVPELSVDVTWYQQVFSKELAWVTEHNVTRAAYHNTAHLIGVSLLVWHLAGKLPSPSPQGNGIDIAKAAMVAGLLHDFCYTCKSCDEDTVRFSLAEAERKGFWTAFPQYSKALVERIVLYTTYDFANPFPALPTDPVQAYLFTLIRDADQLYGTVFLDRAVFDGLYEEIGKRFHFSRPFFLERNKHYVANNRFYTPAATALSKAYLPRALSLMSALKTSPLAPDAD